MRAGDQQACAARCGGCVFVCIIRGSGQLVLAAGQLDDGVHVVQPLRGVSSTHRREEPGFVQKQVVVAHTIPPRTQHNSHQRKGRTHTHTHTRTRTCTRTHTHTRMSVT